MQRAVPDERVPLGLPLLDLGLGGGERCSGLLDLLLRLGDPVLEVRGDDGSAVDLLGVAHCFWSSWVSIAAAELDAAATHFAAAVTLVNGFSPLVFAHSA